MTTVYLIRHGEAEGNCYRRCHGHYDSAVTGNGYRQLAALAKRMESVPLDAAYTSDLTRTRTTALAITRTHTLPLRPDPRLREVGVGVWEDRTWAWLARFDTERLIAFNTDAQRWRVEGGETMEQVRSRMLAALHGIIAAHPKQSVAVISHGMALRALIGTLRGLTLPEIDKTEHAENTAVTKLEADERGVRVIFSNDASHLSEELTTLHKQVWTKSRNGLEPGLWFAPRTAGRFDVMCENERVGAVAVELSGGVAELRELWLDEALRRRGFGIRLVGQAVSYARANGRDVLWASPPPYDETARRRLREYGFTERSGSFEKYIGYDEAYRLRCFDEAFRALDADRKTDGKTAAGT